MRINESRREVLGLYCPRRWPRAETDDFTVVDGDRPVRQPSGVDVDECPFDE